MKCVNCSTTLYVGRNGLKCTSCKHENLLHPRSDQVNEYWIRMQANKAAHTAHPWLTINQLTRMRYRRSYMADFFTVFTTAGLIGCIYFSITEKQPGLLWPAFFFGIFLFISLTARPSPEKIRGNIRRAVKHRPDFYPNVILDPGLNEMDVDGEEIEQVGSEGVLVCDRNILVDWLVRNRLHLDLKMVVISESGYPQNLKPVVEKMLSNNPDTPVYLLHGQTSPARTPESRLKAFNLPDNLQIQDLGLNVGDGKAPKKLWIKNGQQLEFPVDYYGTSRLGAALTGMAAGGAFAALLMSTDKSKVSTFFESSDFG